MAKLASDSVNSSKIVDGSITGTDIAPSTVTSTNILDGTIATADIGTSQITTSLFATLPQCRAKRTSTINIGSGSWHTITLNGEDYDVGTPSNNMFTASDTKMYARVAGCYLCTANLAWNLDGTGVRGARITFNGTSGIIAETEGITPSASTYTQLSVAGVFRFSANQYCELEGYQDTGGNLAALDASTTSLTCLTMNWLSP